MTPKKCWFLFAKNVAKSFSYAILLLLLAFSQYSSIASALSAEQKKVFQEQIYYYDVATCASTPAEASEPTVNNDGTIDITSIVNKYNLQSAMIQKRGANNALASYKANEPPVTPASTMKLIIADTALQSGLDLSKKVSVGGDVFYAGNNDLNGGPSRITLQEALIEMLSHSSNVGANVLMKAMGGVDAFTQKAQNYGYSNTTVKGYYDPSNDGENTSTISDEVNAMNHIFSTNGSDYETAQSALKEAAQSDNYYSVDDIANKWAGTSQVAGNVGLFNINGNQYIIGLYRNNSSDSSKSTIKNASADLVDAIENTGADPSESPSPDACCPPAAGGDVTSLTGKDNIEKTINFFVQEGLSLQQAAGIAANLAWETGGGEAIDPLISGPTPSGAAWGIAQWTPPSHYTDDKKYMNDHSYPVTGSDADLLTQLQVLWGQIQGKGTIYSTNILPGLERTDSAGDAADYFRENFERCDTSNASCTVNRVQTANDFFNKYNGGGLDGGFVAGDADACGAAGAGQQGTAAAAVAAAKLLSSYKLGYVWGGLHGPEELDITDPAKLRKLGADCSGSVTWVLHQAGMFGSTGAVSGDLESWGQAGKGEQMTVWSNSEHTYIEFNIPGLGHYELNTSYNDSVVAPDGIPSTTPGATGPGPRFFKATSGSSYYMDPSGFTPRHWPGT